MYLLQLKNHMDCIKVIYICIMYPLSTFAIYVYIVSLYVLQDNHVKQCSSITYSLMQVYIANANVCNNRVQAQYYSTATWINAFAESAIKNNSAFPLSFSLSFSHLRPRYSCCCRGWRRNSTGNFHARTAPVRRCCWSIGRRCCWCACLPSPHSAWRNIRNDQTRQRENAWERSGEYSSRIPSSSSSSISVYPRDIYSPIYLEKVDI